MGEGREDKRDSQPFILKLGFALAISLAGYFASQFRAKPQLSPPSTSSSGNDRSTKSCAKSSIHSLSDELHVLTSEEALAKVINGTSTTTTAEASTLSDEEGFLLPEFNRVVMDEFEACPDKNHVKSVEKGLEFEEREEMEREIAYLRNLIEALKERERSLEMQMIEYYGLKEQESLLRELENRLKVNATEHELLTLKIESLQVENQNLQAQASDYPKLAVKLECAREEIRLLKEKLKVDGEQAKEELAALHQRITEIQDGERKHQEDDFEVEKKLKRLKELEDEVRDLRKVNSRLAEENLKFSELLESMKMEASSHPNPHELQVEAMEVASNLREENDNLKKEIEQLQTDQCADVEELVYLRWVNACLRYELRNYQPPPGKTVARDLSKCLSPESERRAKQLILEYADSGTHTKNLSLSFLDFDTESCTSSQTSSEEYSDASFDVTSSAKHGSSRKSKLITKLKNLVLGKDDRRSKADSFEGTNGRNSSDSISSCISVENASADQLRNPRLSLDAQRTRWLDLVVRDTVAEHRRSDLGTSHGHMRTISEDRLSDLGPNQGNEDAVVREKVKLMKFADVLKGSVKSRRRLASIG